MDPIISKLNEIAQKKVKESSSTGTTGVEGSQFQKKLDSTFAERLLERLQGTDSPSNQTELKALSAQDIHVEVQNVEVAGKESTPQDKFFGLFEEMNSEVLKLDAAVETLADPGIKLTPRDITMLQITTANSTLLAEGFSRFTESVARGIQTIVQTQVG